MKNTKNIFIYGTLFIFVCLDIVFGNGFPVYTFIFCSIALLYLYIKPYVI